MMKVLAEHIEINQYYCRMKYKKDSVIRDKEKRDHYNYMILSKEKRDLELKQLDQQISEYKNDIYLLKNINNPVIPALESPALLSINNCNQNVSQHRNINTNINVNMEHKNNNANNSSQNNFRYRSERKQRDIQHQLCDHCNLNQIESLEHFICVCPKFEKQRNIWRDKLQKIDNRLRNIWFDINILLFPYIKNVLRKNIPNQLLIWKYLLQFIYHTNIIRFNYSNYTDLDPNRWSDLLEYEKSKMEKQKLIIKLKNDKIKTQQQQNENYNKRRRLNNNNYINIRS